MLLVQLEEGLLDGLVLIGQLIHVEAGGDQLVDREDAVRLDVDGLEQALWERGRRGIGGSGSGGGRLRSYKQVLGRERIEWLNRYLCREPVAVEISECLTQAISFSIHSTIPYQRLLLRDVAPLELQAPPKVLQGHGPLAAVIEALKKTAPALPAWAAEVLGHLEKGPAAEDVALRKGLEPLHEAVGQARDVAVGIA